VRGGFWAWVLWCQHINHSLLLLAMTTSSNNNHLQGVVLTQKQEWVMQKISLMETQGKFNYSFPEQETTSGPS